MLSLLSTKAGRPRDVNATDGPDRKRGPAMDDPASHQPQPPRDPLALLRGKLPRGWECWRGISGLLYARRRRSSPPVVLGSTSADDLARQVPDRETAS